MHRIRCTDDPTQLTFKGHMWTGNRDSHSSYPLKGSYILYSEDYLASYLLFLDGISKGCLKFNKDLSLLMGVSTIPTEDIKKHYPSIKDIYEINEEHLPFDEVKGGS